MFIQTDWTGDGHWAGINIRQSYRVTAGILAFHSVVRLPLSRWRVVLGDRNQKSWGKQITAFLNRCCCFFLTAGHGYNCVCFDFSQHSPHRLLQRQNKTFFFSFFFLNLCLTSPLYGLQWEAWCEKNNTLKFGLGPLDASRRPVKLLPSQFYMISKIHAVVSFCCERNKNKTALYLGAH